jgi:hypothetical protein
MSRVTPIQQLISNRLAELDLSFRAAAERSGGLISHSTINHLLLGRMSPPIRERTAQGLALALDVARSKVDQAAQASIEGTEFRLPENARNLNPRQRRAVYAMISALLNEEEPDSD